VHDQRTVMIGNQLPHENPTPAAAKKSIHFNKKATPLQLVVVIVESCRHLLP
jgi:hypothetical protein